jgi:hypothetical protein
MRTCRSFLSVFLTCAVLFSGHLSRASDPLPKTPTALHLSPEGRDVYRQGFLAGREDKKASLSADHHRHAFPAAYEDAFRCGYIRGLTYGWFAFGITKRIAKEYPQYLEDYEKQQVHW